MRALLVAALTALAVAGCTSGGTSTDCGLDGCTITFPRGATGEVSVLGVNAKLVGVDAGQATVEVAGNTVRVPVGGETAADGYTVGVERITDSEVVVRAGLGGGGGG